MGGDFPQDLFVDREEHLQATLLDVIIPKENDHLKESVGGGRGNHIGRQSYIWDAVFYDCCFGGISTSSFIMQTNFYNLEETQFSFS